MHYTKAIGTTRRRTDVFFNIYLYTYIQGYIGNKNS